MKIKDMEFYASLFFMIQSCLGGFIIDDSIKLVQNDAWIIPIVGSIIGFIVLKLYLYIFNSNVNISKLFKTKIVNNIYIILIILLMNTVFLSLISFISTSYLYDTPPLFIVVLLTLTILYVLAHKTSSLFRTVLIIFYIFLTIYFIVTIGLIRQINFLNIMPIFTFKTTNFITAIFHYVIYTTIPLLSMIYYKKNITENISNKKITITYFLAHLSIFIIIFTLILVFGSNLASVYQFPGYQILKRAFAGAFIERLEKILAIYWIISMLIPIIIWANIILNKLKRNYLIVILILMSNYYLLTNITLITYWNETLFPIIMSLFIVLSVLICIKKKLIN